MTISILELNCLNEIGDDWESVTTIGGPIRHETHAKVTDDEIGRCLLELTRIGLANAFEVGVGGGKLVRLNDVPGDWRDKWFFITPQGRAELDANWVET